jgi:hypothetical protein
MGLLNDDDQNNQNQNQDPNAPVPEWINALPDDMRSEESITSLRKFKPAEGEELVPMPLSVAKSYRELEQKFGSNHIVIPGQDAAAEEWNPVYTALGRPETVDGYGFQKPDWPEGLEYSEDITRAYAAKAHELGMSKAQARGIFDWFNDHTLDNFNAMNKTAADFEAATEAELRKEWGTQYDANMKKCRMVGNSIGGTDFMKFLQVTGLENDPRIIRFLYGISTRVSEATLLDGTELPLDGRIPTKAELETMMKDPRYGLLDRSQLDQAYYDKVQALWKARVEADQAAARQTA